MVRRVDGTDEDVIATGKTQRDAERVERGVTINLDYDNWYVFVEEESS